VILARGFSPLARKALGGAAAAALAITCTAAASPVAQAASVPAPGFHLDLSALHIATRETFTLPAGTRSISASAGQAHVRIVRPADSPMITISCQLTVYDPAYEGTTNGEFGTANIECNLPVEEIYLVVALLEYSSVVSENANENYSSSSLSVVTTYGFSPGTYQTGAAGTVYFPAGYSPSSGSVGPDYSPSMYIE
jgi:hypothetical protein